MKSLIFLTEFPEGGSDRMKQIPKLSDYAQSTKKM